jgi:RNA polymerase sigma factor (sigma-70 family)
MTTDAHHETERRRAFWSQACVDNYPRLRSYAWRLADNGDIAEDVVQDTVLKILRLVPNPETIGHKLNYLLRSVHNTWVDWLKEHDQFVTTSIDDPDNQEVHAMAAPERDADIDAQTEAFRLAMQIELRRLNQREKDILERYLEGFACDEIAARMGEDVRVISYELNAIKTKVRYRVQRSFPKPKRPDGQ